MEQAYDALVKELRRQGLLDPQAEPDQATLAGLLASLPPNQTSAQILQDISVTASTKTAKEARRLLHLWRSRGFIPASFPGKGGQTWRLNTGPRPIEAFFSQIDGHGGRLLIYSFSQPANPYCVFVLAGSDVKGLLSAEVYQPGNRRDYRDLVNAFRATEGFTYAGVDPAYCRAWLKHYHRLSRQNRQPVPREFELYRPSLGPEEPLPRPLIYDRLDPDEVNQNRASLLASSGEMLEEIELVTWFFEGPQVEKAVEQLQARQQSGLIVSKSTEQALVEKTKQQLLNDLLTPEFAQLLARRLEETAYLFWETDRPLRARQAVAVAQTLRQDNSPAWALISFCRKLIEKTIALAASGSPAGSDQTYRHNSGLYIPGRGHAPGAL